MRSAVNLHVKAVNVIAVCALHCMPMMREQILFSE